MAVSILPSGRRALPLAVVLAGCARAAAPAPPSGAPAFSAVQTVSGVPVVIAARATRALQVAGFATRRFSADSTWAVRSSEDAAARLRFVRPANDSTRVLFEIWLPCAGQARCGHAEAKTFFLRIGEEEGLPDVAPE